MKKIISIFLAIFIIGIVAFWLYLLYTDYQSLPRDSGQIKFTLFQMKSLLFTIFVIATLTVIMYAQLSSRMEENTGGPRKYSRKSDLEQYSASHTEQEAVNVVANLEVVRQLLHNNLDTIDKMWDGFSQAEQDNTMDTASEEVLLAELAAQTALIKTDNLKSLLDKLVDVSAEVTGARRVSLFLTNVERDRLKLIKGTGWGPLTEEISIGTDEGIAGYSFTQNKRIYVTNIETHPELGRKNKPQYHSKSFIIFPIKLFYDENVLGVLNLTEKADGDGIFSMEDLEKINILMNSFALKMENMVLKDELGSLKSS